jgi:predicted GNAT family acetyltransferase
MKQTPREPDHDPSEPRNLSGVQFQYTYPGAPKQHPDLHTVTARTSEGKYLGFMDWHKKTGRIDNISVTENMRGLGVASAMYDKATKLASDTGIKSPQHSTHRTDKGDAWARKVGGNVPPRKAEPEEY